MKNLFFKTVMWKGSGTTVNRQSTDGQVQRRYSLTPISKRWKALVALLFLFTLSIGQMWGAGDLTSPYTLTFDNSSSGVGATIAANKSVSTDASGAVATGDAIKATWTVTLANNNTALAKNSNGLKVGNSNSNDVYDATFSSSSFSSLTITQIEVKVKNNTSSNSGKVMTTTTTVSVGGAAFDVAKSITNTTTATALTFAPSTGKSGNISINIANTGEYINHYFVQYIKVTFSSGGSTTNYTVTLNPNGGSYASTPSGWTASGSNITKTVSAGALAIPEPSQSGYDFDGWKDKFDNAVTLSSGSLTVSKDTILTAQWTETPVTPVCPSGISISGTKAYTEGQTISLSAALTEGNGTISYQWYKGSIASGNEVGTGATFTKSNCATGDAANYYCVASKDGCSNAESSAYAVTVAEKTCPTSGVVYSTKVKSSVSSNQSFPASATTEVSPTTQADIVGGKMYGINGQTSAKNLIASSSGYKFCMTNNNTTFKLKLDCPIQAGDKITLDYLGGSKSGSYDVLGVWVATSNDRPSSAPACAATASSGSKTLSYIVTAGSIYENAEELYLHRATGGSTYFNNVVITRPYAITFSSAKGSAPSATTGFEVDLTQITGVDGWIHTGWTADVAVKVGGETKTAGTALAVDATAVLSANTTFTAVWEEDITQYTVTYYDGEAIEANKLGSELINEGSNPTGAGLSPTKHGYTFGGWSLTNGGAAVVLNTISVVKDTSLFVVWTPLVCPTGGIVFSAVADPNKAPGSDYKIAGNTRADLATYATISGGTALFGNANSDQSVTIKATTSKIAFSGSNMRGYVKVTMDCDLKVGDIIRIADNSNKFRIAFDSTATDKVDVSSGNHDVVIDADHKDKYEFFVYRNGNDVNFGSIQVLRPYTVSFNMNGQSATAIADQKVLAGEKVTKPTDPEVTGQAFGGWFTNAACTSGNEWAFATATVSQDTTLYAKWTALKSMTLNAGTGTGDDIVSYPTVGDPVAVPACPATFEKSGYNFAGWAYSPSVEVENGQFTMPDANLTLTAQWEDASKVAAIVETSVKYESLAAAIAAATTGQTVQLLQNVDVTEQIDVAGKAIILDLAGYKIEYTGTETLTSGVLLVPNGASLTINDSSDPDAGSIVAGNKAYAAIALTKLGDTDFTNPAVLVVNGGTLSGLYYAITGNGNRHNTQITINGGTITATAAGDNQGIYHPQNGTLTVNGGTITAYSAAIEMRAGELEINGGTFTATATDFSCDPNGNGTTTIGAAIAIAQHTTKKDIAVTISGGTFSGVKAINESNPHDNDPAPHVTMAITAGTFTGAVETVDVNHFISGGTFSAAVTESQCATGYYPATKPNGKYGVTVAAVSVDFAAEAAKTSGQKAWATFLTDNHYDYNVGEGGEVSWDKTNTYDTGLKLKKSNANAIYFSTEPDQLITLTVGNIAGMTIQINGGDVQTITGGSSATNLGVSYYYSANAQDVVLKETSGSSGYNMLKSIKIEDPYQVSFSGEGTPLAPMTFEGEGLTLPTTEPGLGNTKRLDHWCTDADATIPVTLDANGKYWPTGDITLYAAYKTLYELSFNGNGADIVSSMDPLYYAAGDEVAVPACTFEKTDLTFAGWTYSPSVTVENGKFSMPSSALVLTATWEDLSKVVKVVRDNYEQSYDNFLAARNDVRDNGGTIILLQDLEESLYYGIAADITIDLNGHRMASDDGNDLFLVYDGGKLTINGTTTGSQFHGRINVGSNAGSDGTLILNGGTYTCASGNTCIHVHGESDASEVTLNGVILSSPDDNGVQFNGYGTFTVTDATITGGTGIYIKSGVLTITNSTVTGTLTPQNYSYYGNGAYPTGDGIVVDACNYPGGAPTINIISGTFTGTKGAVGSYNYQGTSEPAIGGIQGGSFSSRVPSDLCAPGLVPSEENPETHMYTVEPKEPICIIKSTPTSGTEASVDGVLKGSAFFTGRANDKKLNSKYDNVGVQLKEGYTFLATDKVVLNQTADLGTDDLKKFYVFYEKPADGKTYATILNASPVKGDNWFDMPEEIVGKSSLYVGRVDANCNPSVGYLAVYRVSAPILNKVTVAGVDGTPDAQNKVAIELPFTTTDAAFEAIAYDWVSNNDAWTADPANAPVAANAWEWGVENTVTFTDKDGDESEYYITISKAAVSSDATLSALTYGDPATAITLADDVYEYDVELPYGTSAVPALAATTNHAGASVTDIDDADAFVNRHATSTVTVTAEDGTTTQLYTVNFTVSRFESKVLWDGSTMTQMSDITAAATAAGVSITTTGISPTSFTAKTCEENGKSYTKALDFGGKTQSTRYFGIEIPAGKVAKVSLVYRAKSTSRSIMVATALSDAVNESTITSKEAVDGSNLYIMTADMFGGGTLYINTTDGYHVHEISIQLADGHARSAMLGAGVFGTVCVPNNVAVEDIQGVTVYELMGREPQYGKLAFDEIVSGELEAGVPYVFQAHRNHMALLYGTEHKDAPVNKGNGMYGTFEYTELTELAGIYYFAQRALWSCVDLTVLKVPANRAYVKLGEIDYINSEPAPGRKRITMTVNGEQVATGVENAETIQEGVQKIMIDGQLFILRGEKMYDATGRLVK